MSNLKKIARRTFLLGSSAIAGGVAFGVYATRKPYKNPLKEQLSAGEATFNPWIKISQDGITLVTPHADLGQGATSMQALLIAEEMDLAWGAFETTYGMPDPAYYNRALAGELAPFTAHDNRMRARLARDTFSAVAKLAGIQGTGGSSSVPDSFDKLRRAGAIARETLKRAAAETKGTPVEQLKTADGNVVLPDGQRLPYTSLAEAASKIEPVTDVTLRDAADWRLIGSKTLTGLGMVARSTGTERYGIDIRLDGMIYAAVTVNPGLGGGVKSVNSDKALASPGVSDVLRVSNGVAVIADNTWNAFKGIRELDIDWAPAPYPSEQSAHWKAVDESFTESCLDKQWRDDGDVSTALAQRAPIEREYRAPYLAHQPLEPLNATVRVSDAGVEVWCGHQLPRFVQQKVADIAGCDPDAVLFYNQHAGGSFGHRLEFNNVVLATEIAMKKPGKAVKLTYSREEDFAEDYVRQIGMARARGVVNKGRIETVALDIATPSVSASQTARLGQPPQPVADKQIPSGAWNLPYRIPNFRVRTYRVPELAPVSSWRSVGASTAGFFADTFIDEMAHEAGADPLLERLRLTTRAESRAVLEAVADMSDWGGAIGDKRGRGVAFVDSFGVPVAEVVEVIATENGIIVDKVWVAADVGQIIDPDGFDQQVQGGVIWGLGHAMNCEITFSGGRKQQSNFHQHSGMRIHQCPDIHVRGLELASRIRGIGEPTVPPAAPALGNAIFAATGQRLREMPFDKFVTFA